MARFKVIKAHDGLEKGALKELPASRLTAYMVENGYWQEVEVKEAEAKPKSTKTKTAKK